MATAAAALALMKKATAATVVPARRISNVVGGRLNRKQAQAVRAMRDVEKAERKGVKSKAHKEQ